MQQDLGLPVVRRRTYGVAINKSRLAWVGPENSGSDITKDFLDVFAEQVLLDGDCFVAVDSAASVVETRAELARKRGMFASPESLPMMSLFTKQTQERMQSAMSAYRKACPDDEANKALIMDVSQSDFRSRANCLLPSATKSCQLVSMSRQHIFTQNEVDFSMGWPVLDRPGQKYAHLVPGSLKVSGSSARRRLCGNGMCMQQVLAWFLYVQAHCVRKQLLMKWSPPLLDACYEDERRRAFAAAAEADAARTKEQESEQEGFKKGVDS